MKENLAATTPSVWYVYMVRCSDDTLYTGITTDIEKRVAAHNFGKDGAKYTRSRRPVRLVYQEGGLSRSEAAKREYCLRRLSVSHKERLIAKNTL